MHAERHELDGELLAVHIRGSSFDEGFRLVNTNEDALQVGRNVRPEGYHAPAHWHPSPEAPPAGAARQEVLHVLRGRVRVDLFTTQGKQGPSLEVFAGDTLFLSAGHAVTFLEASELLEVKQGPYAGPERDKRWIR